MASDAGRRSSCFATARTWAPSTDCATGTSMYKSSPNCWKPRRRGRRRSASRSRPLEAAPPVAARSAPPQGTPMKTLSIPVRVIGPGSQPEEEPLQYLDMPRDMNTFQMPLVPERADSEALSESRDALAEFLDALEPWDP